MRAYWVLARNVFASYAVYRLNLFLEIAGSALVTLSVYFLWRAAFAQTTTIGGFTQPQMLTYVLGGGLLQSFVLFASQGDVANEEIKVGTIALRLTKPLSILGGWFAQDLARRLLNLLLALAAFVLLIILIHPPFVAPVSTAAVGWALVMVLLGALVHFLLFTSIAMGAFWVSETWAQRFIVRVVLEIATGALVPLAFFPSVIGQILRALPFGLMAGTPMELYLGKRPLETIGPTIVAGIVWVIALAIVCRVVYHRGIRHFSATGG